MTESQPWIFETKKLALRRKKYLLKQGKVPAMIQKKYNPGTRKNYYQMDW